MILLNQLNYVTGILLAVPLIGGLTLHLLATSLPSIRGTHDHTQCASCNRDTYFT
jgi:hypothetical protein